MLYWSRSRRWCEVRRRARRRATGRRRSDSRKQDWHERAPESAPHKAKTRAAVKEGAADEPKPSRRQTPYPASGVGFAAGGSISNVLAVMHVIEKLPVDATRATRCSRPMVASAAA